MRVPGGRFEAVPGLGGCFSTSFFGVYCMYSHVFAVVWKEFAGLRRLSESFRKATSQDHDYDYC